MFALITFALTPASTTDESGSIHQYTDIYTLDISYRILDSVRFLCSYILYTAAPALTRPNSTLEAILMTQMKGVYTEYVSLHELCALHIQSATDVAAVYPYMRHIDKSNTLELLLGGVNQAIYALFVSDDTVGGGSLGGDKAAVLRDYLSSIRYIYSHTYILYYLCQALACSH